MKKLDELLTRYFCDEYEINPDQNYEIEEIDAKELLTIDRLDLIPKLIWIKANETGDGIKYANELYDAHIIAITGRTGKEPGKEHEKNSPQKFREIFKSLLAIGKEGFNSNISVIPVGMNNTIMDGAHRTAIGIYYGMKLPIVRFPSLFAHNKYYNKYSNN